MRAWVTKDIRTYARRQDTALQHGLARINLDIHQRFFLVRVTVGAPPLRVDVNRKSSRRRSRECEIGGGARFDVFLDIISRADRQGSNG